MSKETRAEISERIIERFIEKKNPVESVWKFQKYSRMFSGEICEVVPGKLLKKTPGGFSEKLLGEIFGEIPREVEEVPKKVYCGMFSEISGANLL